MSFCHKHSLSGKTLNMIAGKGPRAEEGFAHLASGVSIGTIRVHNHQLCHKNCYIRIRIRIQLRPMSCGHNSYSSTINDHEPPAVYVGVVCVCVCVCACVCVRGKSFLLFYAFGPLVTPLTWRAFGPLQHLRGLGGRPLGPNTGTRGQ